MKRNMFKGVAELEVIVIIGLILIAVAVAYLHYAAPKPKPKVVPAITLPEVLDAIRNKPVNVPEAPKATIQAPAPAAIVPAPVKAVEKDATAMPVTVNISTAPEGGWVPYVLGAFFCFLFLKCLPGLMTALEYVRTALVLQPAVALAGAGHASMTSIPCHAGVTTQPETEREIKTVVTPPVTPPAAPLDAPPAAPQDHSVL